MMFGSGIIFYLLGLVILYFIIETAVRNGINNSVIGRKLTEEVKEKKNTFLDDDLDKD